MKSFVRLKPSTKLSEIGIPVQLENALWCLGITTVGQFMRAKYIKLMRNKVVLDNWDQIIELSYRFKHDCDSNRNSAED